MDSASSAVNFNPAAFVVWGDTLSTSYIIGIDLGTTNSALAATELSQPDLAGSIACAEVEQLIAPAELAVRPLLPSSLYLLEGPELPKGSTRLPWTKDDLPYVVHAEHLARRAN